MTRFDDIQARHAAATKEWDWKDKRFTDPPGNFREADAWFFCHCPDDVRWLLDRVTDAAEIPNAIQGARHAAENSTARAASESDWDSEAYYRAKAEGLAEAEKIARAALDTEQPDDKLRSPDASCEEADGTDAGPIDDGESALDTEQT